MLDMRTGKGPVWALAFIYIAIASLLIDMVLAVPRVQKVVNFYLSRVDLAADRHELRGLLFLVLRNYLWPCFREFWWLGVQTALLAFVISYFTEVLIMGLSIDLMHFGQFNYGQLISVMVWAPTLGKFVCFSICECLLYTERHTKSIVLLGMRLTRAQVGIEEGFGRRLAKNYRVVRDVYEGESYEWEYGIQHCGYEHGFDWIQRKQRSQMSVSTMSTLELKTSDLMVPGLAGPKACYRQITSLPRNV